MTDIPEQIRGWWRIVETSQWMDDGLDDLGPALISFTGDDDRLRMHCLLAHVEAIPAGSGVRFMWQGAWEFDPVSGTGNARVGKDGRLTGEIRIKNGDDSTFTAVKPEDFVRRFLLHILPKGLNKNRHYGLYAPASVRTTLRIARNLVGHGGTAAPNAANSAFDAVPLADDATAMSAAELFQRLTGVDPRRCPVCAAAPMSMHPVAPTRLQQARGPP